MPRNKVNLRWQFIKKEIFSHLYSVENSAGSKCFISGEIREMTRQQTCILHDIGCKRPINSLNPLFFISFQNMHASKQFVDSDCITLGPKKLKHCYKTVFELL